MVDKVVSTDVCTYIPPRGETFVIDKVKCQLLLFTNILGCHDYAVFLVCIGKLRKIVVQLIVRERYAKIILCVI